MLERQFLITTCVKKTTDRKKNKAMNIYLALLGQTLDRLIWKMAFKSFELSRKVWSIIRSPTAFIQLIQMTHELELNWITGFE